MYIVIMAGGKGTRFWPRSRAKMPKQLLDIISDRTMIQETVDRVLPMVPQDRILIVTNREQFHTLSEQLPGIPKQNIITEPVGRNTAPCICLAATRIINENPEEVMAVLPADHYIENGQSFCKCLGRAGEVARSRGALVTIGVRPHKPETGYGYIQYDSDSAEEPDVYRVEQFHEKPDLSLAEQYLKSGSYLWNSGMFVWKASAILSEIEKHLPQVFSRLSPLEKHWGTPEIDKLIEDAYEETESISIDYGVMEKSDNVFTLVGDFGWNDIGSWTAVRDISPRDKNSNMLRGQVITVNTKNSIVYSPGKLTAVVGLENVIVVDTGDALLVCSADKDQDVRSVVELLEKQGKKELL